MPTITNLEFLTTEQACEILKITRQTLYKLCERGEIHGKKVGSKYRFTQTALDQYMQGHAPQAPTPSQSDAKEWMLTGDFATAGIKKMARRTFQELSSNIEELVVNSYDADANVVHIFLDYDKETLNIIDDGSGMGEEALAQYVIYGESKKSSSYYSPKYKRSPIGEYGMGGKLAITNLCHNCKIVTRKEGKEHTFHMNKGELDKAKLLSDVKTKVLTRPCAKEQHGTAVYMEKLLYKNIDRERLIERLSTKMPKSQNFKIIMHITHHNESQEFEIEEPKFECEREFKFEEKLSLIGTVRLCVYFTKDPIPAAKQGVWTKVNGRIVNEKQEWFGLLNLTSGNRYRWRLYGIGEADGLKDFITFSKNDFIDCPEYREYFDFVHSSLAEVQKVLLKIDEDAKKERDRSLVKNMEQEVNDAVSKLENPLILNNLAQRIKKEKTKELEEAPEAPYSDFEKIEEKASAEANLVTRGKDKRERRNQSLSKSEKMTYSGKKYNIATVDLSESGDLVKFTKEKNLIEINEKHRQYLNASKQGGLNLLVRELAFAQIANDWGEGSQIVFNSILNELEKIHSSKSEVVEV